MHGVQHITQKTAHALARASRGLKVLDLRSCTRVSAADVAKVQASLPNCRVITGEGDPLDDIDDAPEPPKGEIGVEGGDISFV